MTRRSPLLSRAPLGVSWASPFSGRLATTTGRNEFVILRTGYSPPVASHLSLGDAVTFGYNVRPNIRRDFHPADSIRSQAHQSRYRDRLVGDVTVQTSVKMIGAPPRSGFGESGDRNPIRVGSS